MKQHVACPLDGCGSSDAYTMYEDGHGWCYSCNRGYFPKPLRPEDFEKKYIGGHRRIDQKFCELARVWSYVDKDDNVIFREYEYGDEGSIMRRVHDKKMWTKGKPAALGGMELWNAGSSHYITVVEGGEDGAAAMQMLNGGATVNPVVWLKSGSIAAKDRESIYNYLSKFETVKLAIEDDEKGKQAKELLCQMLPNKIREVPLTKYKDANDYLINGASKEFKQAWNNAAIYTPDNIFHTEDDVYNILTNGEIESYVESPFQSLNDIIRGVPLNHVTLITGMEGLGKTEILRAMEYKILSEGVPCAVLHQEETKKTLYQGLACYELGENARDPDAPLPAIDVLRAVGSATGGFENLFVFEFKRDPSVSEIMEQINYLVHVCGVRYVFIDPINQFDPVDGNMTKVEFLESLSKKMEKYAANNPVGIVWTAHVNDEGKTMHSRMIAKACSIRIDIGRDLDSDDDTIRNTTFLRVSKNRPFAKTGKAGCVTWDERTFTVVSSELPLEIGEGNVPF